MTEVNNTPKQQLHEIMVEMFLMIEEMNTNENQYLQFAEMFKQMNLNINRLAEMKQLIIQNIYYQRYVCKTTTTRRKRLTEEQKRKDINYTACNCGRYIHIDFHKEHLKSQVHYQGRRNRKYSSLGMKDDQVNKCINREVAIQAFIINHLVKVKNINIDNSNDDELN